MANAEVEKAFETTTKLLFSQPISGIDNYEEFLTKRVPKGNVLPSSTNGKMIYFPGYSAFRLIPNDRIADAKSFSELSKRNIDVSDDENMNSISKKFKDKSAFIVEFEEGTNVNVESSTIYMGLVNAYKTMDCFHSKNIAYSFFSDNCDHAFGVSKSFNCNFSINCHDSRDIVRSFEIDFSKNCSDAMFCHDVDNVHSSMFCFNTKNLRYAIANQVVGKEIYEKTKKMLCGYILKELKAKQKLEMDIYNIGCR
jgi:hypothetical protein